MECIPGPGEKAAVIQRQVDIIGRSLERMAVPKLGRANRGNDESMCSGGAFH